MVLPEAGQEEPMGAELSRDAQTVTRQEVGGSEIEITNKAGLYDQGARATPTLVKKYAAWMKLSKTE